MALTLSHSPHWLRNLSIFEFNYLSFNIIYAMKKCQENVWVLEHLNSEQELSIKIEKDVAKHYHVNTKTSFWLLSNGLKTKYRWNEKYKCKSVFCWKKSLTSAILDKVIWTKEARLSILVPGLIILTRGWIRTSDWWRLALLDIQFFWEYFDDLVEWMWRQGGLQSVWDEWISSLWHQTLIV